MVNIKSYTERDKTLKKSDMYGIFKGFLALKMCSGLTRNPADAISIDWMFDFGTGLGL